MESLDHVISSIADQAESLLTEAIDIAEIPAPPFGETERSLHIARRFREVGLADVTVDELGNVTGRRPRPGAPRIMVVSHMDTVFPPGTEVKARRDGDRVYCPGIRDNSAAVANLISLARILGDSGLALPCDLTIASSVGEEGLGDLRGMRRLMADWRDRLDAVVGYDGNLGNVVHGGVGSRRYTVTYRAAGGHSYIDFGNASAVHGLAAACYRFSQIPVPAEPRTTLNVGTFHGGSSVNAIAEQAAATIDMRSASGPGLADLTERALEVFRTTAAEFDCQVTFEEVGHRPGRTIPVAHPLVAAATEVLVGMGIEPRVSVSSTDINIPLSLGMPAVCVGSSVGKGMHTLGESLHIPTLVPGLQQLVRLLARLDRSVIQ